MSVIRLPIDINSLYFNIKNDNEKGHTATVATPLKQGASVHKELSKIHQISCNINDYSRGNLIGQILARSRAEAVITEIFVFDSIAVNGLSVECDSSFCMYIREETNPENVHCGRQKIHYPVSLKYSDSEVEIDNRKVVAAVSAKLHEYAFIVEAFEYNTETKTLNFDATVVGENGIPYSKIFLNKRGVGNKFSSVFNEFADTYNAEIVSLRAHLGYSNVTPENYMGVVNENKKTAIQTVEKSLLDKGFLM